MVKSKTTKKINKKLLKFKERNLIKIKMIKIKNKKKELKKLIMNKQINLKLLPKEIMKIKKN